LGKVVIKEEDETMKRDVGRGRERRKKDELVGLRAVRKQQGPAGGAGIKLINRA
jgi:hypothetical protein